MKEEEEERGGCPFWEWPMPCGTGSDAHLLGWGWSDGCAPAAVGEGVREPLGSSRLTSLPSWCVQLHDGAPVMSLKVWILLLRGSGRLWSSPRAGLVALSCPADVGAEILALQSLCGSID